MANYSFYQVHIRAEKKAALMIYRLLPDAFEDKAIVFEQDTDNGYVLHVKGECQWEIDAHRQDSTTISAVDLSAFDEDGLREGTIDLTAHPFAYTTLRVLSALFDCEIQSYEVCPESPSSCFTHCKGGVTLVRRLEDAQWLEWDKERYPTLSDFCCAHRISAEDAPCEEDFTPDSEGIWGCLYLPSPTFDF